MSDSLIGLQRWITAQWVVLFVWWILSLSAWADSPGFDVTGRWFSTAGFTLNTVVLFEVGAAAMIWKRLRRLFSKPIDPAALDMPGGTLPATVPNEPRDEREI